MEREELELQIAHKEEELREVKNVDFKKAYRRYLKKSMGNPLIYNLIALGAVLAFVAVIVMGVSLYLAGDMDSGKIAALAFLALICAATAAVIFVRDVVSRKKEADMRYSSFIHRHRANVIAREDELSAMKAELEAIKN